MKKAILTFGLFSLVMILTSFTTPETTTNETITNNSTTMDAAGSGSVRNQKLDAAGSGSVRNQKLD